MAVAGLIALVGPYLAFRWRPRRLFHLACVSQGVLCLFTALVGLAMGNPWTASMFGAAGLCFLVANAGVRKRLLPLVGTVLFFAALARITMTEGAEPSLGIVLGVPALCIAGMAYVRDVHTKHRTGSTPSSARAS